MDYLCNVGLKRVIAILALIIFCFTAMVQVYYVAHYVVNYEKYATELCVNKEVKELNCNGQCQLTKEIASSSSNQQKDSKIPVEIFTTYLSPFISEIGIDIDLLCQKLEDQYFRESNLYTLKGYADNVTPPPKSFS